jgi:hypothetical protein
MGAYERTSATITGSAGTNQFYLKLSEDGSQIQLWNGSSPTGNPAQTFDSHSLNSITFTNPSGGNTVYADFSNGSLFNGTLSYIDLSNSSLRVLNGNLSAINSLVASGFNGGNWNGQGIITSSYHSTPQFTGDVSPWTTLAVAQVGSNVIVKYSYMGDVDENGVVNAADFAQMKSGAINQAIILQTRPLAYSDGDIDYNGVINAADFALAKSAALNQGAAMAVAAEVRGGTAETQSAQSSPDQADSAAPAARVAASVFSTQTPIQPTAAILDQTEPVLTGVKDVLA